VTALLLKNAWRERERTALSGAVKPQYAPEPFDVGRYLRVDITLPNGDKCMASSSGVIDPGTCFHLSPYCISTIFEFLFSTVGFI
jgi:hypothetical protein